MAEAAATDDLEVAEVVSSLGGDCFDSFDALQTNIKAYEQAHFVQFWRCDSHTIGAAKKRLNQLLNPVLKYYKLKFCCIHESQNLKPKGKGQRTIS